MIDITDPKKTAAVRRYLAEIVIISLATSVAFLFVKMDDLNKYIREDLLQRSIKTEQVINANTSALQQLTHELETDKRKN